MKLRKPALFILFAGLLLIAAGCGQQPLPTTLPTTQATTISTQPPLSPAEKYARACEEVNAAGNLILSYAAEENRQVGEDTYTEKTTGKASLSRVGQEDMTALVEESLSYGSYETAYTEVYCDGNAYVQVNDCAFGVHMSAEDFVQRQLPALLLDASLYGQVTETEESGVCVLTFSNPSALERWLHVPEGKLLSAEGKAYLNGAGTLTGMDYQAVFFRNSTQYSYTVSVQVLAPQSLDLGAVHPEHFANVVWLQSMDAPKFLLQTVGSVYSSKDLVCRSEETVSSEAIPMTYTQESRFSLLETEEDLQAEASYSVGFSDYREQVFQKTQEESYSNGVLTTIIDGGKPQTSEAVTRQQMREYIEDAVLSGLFASKYIADAVVLDKGDYYRLEFTGNDGYLADMMANVNAFLQTDLDAGASSVETTAAGGYLTVDKATGLPTSMGLELSRVHTIATVAYPLEYRLDQALELPGSRK